MPIAVDANSAGDSSVNVASFTLSHTCNGINRILWVGVYIPSSGADVVTGVTYNAVAMTRAVTLASSDSASVYYLYYLVAPATGANNIIVSVSPNNRIVLDNESYTGVSQAPTIVTGSKTQAAGSTSISNSVTTTVDRSWMVSLMADEGGGTISAGAGTTLRGASNVGSAIGDSNADITPPAAYSMAWTGTGTGIKTMLQAAFNPVFIPPPSYALIL